MHAAQMESASLVANVDGKANIVKKCMGDTY